jgi:pyroglutamyl-peptidase
LPGRFILRETRHKEISDGFPMMARTILVTGFAPFGGESQNSSWRAVQLLEGWTCANRIVVAREIPCAFGVSIRALETMIAELKPEILICVGQAGGRADLSVERIAVNLDDADAPDNEGVRPVNTPVRANAPPAYFSTLPVKAIVAAMKGAGLPASLSSTAGHFVCNHLFFGACHLQATRFEAMRVGFIHVPYALEQGARHPGAPTMATEAVAMGLKIAIETTIGAEISTSGSAV